MKKSVHNTSLWKELYHVLKGNAWKSTHNSFDVPLFVGWQWCVFAVVLVCIFCVALWLHYQEFSYFKNSGYKDGVSVTEAMVLNQYTKNGTKGIYTVLKLQMSNGIVFYTTTKEQLKDIKYKTLRLTLITTKLQFMDYLRGFYAFSIYMELLPTRHGLKESLREFISNQHSNVEIAHVYQTLFLADTLPHAWRKNINAMGIAHLFAISGFHYGIISAFVVVLLYVPYTFMHKRFFPYRNAFYDIGLCTLMVGWLYLLLLENSPSFLRAFGMALWAYYLALCGTRIFSLLSLWLFIGILLAGFPTLVFSVALWLSVAGVFYILLFMHYYSLTSMRDVLSMNMGIYLFMLPLVHFLFEPFSVYSLFSIPLTILFIFFYPLAMLFHIFGIGWFLDDVLVWFVGLDLPIVSISTPLWLLIVWLALSAAATLHKTFFIVLNLVCLFVFFYNLTLFLLK